NPHRQARHTASSQWDSGISHCDREGQRTGQPLGQQHLQPLTKELMTPGPTGPLRGSMPKAARILVAALCVAAAQTLAAEDVTWTNAVKVTVTGNSVTNTGGAGNNWDAGAASLQVIRDGYGYVEFTATETNLSRLCGLSNGDSGVADTDVDFAIKLKPSGVLKVTEGGTEVGSNFTYASGDKLRVEARHGVIRYLKN